MGGQRNLRVLRAAAVALLACCAKPKQPIAKLPIVDIGKPEPVAAVRCKDDGKESVDVKGSGMVVSVRRKGKVLLQEEVTLLAVRIDSSGVEFEDESRISVDRQKAPGKVRDGEFAFLERPRFRNFRVGYDGIMTGDSGFIKEMGWKDFKVEKAGDGQVRVSYIDPRHQDCWPY